MVYSMEALNAIDVVIEKNGILKHPFYQAWQRGELTCKALQDYAGQYYAHVEAFPTYISALHSHTTDGATRQALLENLIDEERGAENHPELWLKFVEAVGVDRDLVRSMPPQPETAYLISEFRSLCGDASVAEGLSALYAYESQIPAVSKTKIDGLVRFYGIRSETGLKYFRVHQEADVKHSADERALLAQYVTPGNSASCVAAAERITSSLWAVLTGVCSRHSIAC